MRRTGGRLDIHRQMIVPCFARRVLQIGEVPFDLHIKRTCGIEQIWSMPLTMELPDLQKIPCEIECILVGLYDVQDRFFNAVLRILSKSSPVVRNATQAVFFFSESG
jgi:hypothetical protein